MLGENLAKNAIIPFPLDGNFEQISQPLVYRPWGTRTLKVKLSTNVDLPRLIIRPERIIPAELALGIYQAYADDTNAFRITWGGGHEAGPYARSTDFLSAFERPAPFNAHEAGYIFFSLTHTGKALPDQSRVSLQAFEIHENDENQLSQPRARLCIPIKKPDLLPETEEIIRVVPAAQDDTWVVSGGSFLPVYDSRWWPSEEVNYEACDPPPLFIRIQNNELLVSWKDEGNLIATVEDFTQPSALQMGESLGFELFAFDQWSFVLRISFFWVDKYIGGDAFVVRHEVPDSERFDMIIRRKDGRVLLACTDLHWREVWARVLPGKLLRATLGMPGEVALKLAKEKWADTWNEVWSPQSKHATKAEPDHTDEVVLINNPVEPYIRLLAAREATVTVKAGGMVAHVPTLHNVEQRRPTVMTSSDVRFG